MKLACSRCWERESCRCTPEELAEHEKMKGYLLNQSFISQFRSLFSGLPLDLRDLKAAKCASIFESNVENFIIWQFKQKIYIVMDETGEKLHWKFSHKPNENFSTKEIFELFNKRQK